MEVPLSRKLPFSSAVRRLALLLLCLMLLAPAATACRSGSSGTTLNLADAGPITLDPALVADSTSASYIVQIFSGLVRLDQNLQVVPDIASSWDTNSDGKTYTFHLRHDVKFDDGKPVTAADFKYSWERALNPATGSSTAGTYLNDIVGAADVLSGRTTQLSGVKILDAYTLQVTIDAPKPYFLEKMAFPTAFVVEQTNVQSGSTWWQHPDGTGPFKLQKWQQGQMLVLQRNDNYYGEKAKLNQVVFTLTGEDPMQLYQGGSIDVASVSTNYMGLVTDPSNPISKELQEFPELSLYYIGFNCSAPPFDDVSIRQAFCLAVNKSRVISLAADNVVAVANGILPPGMPGYNANLQGLQFNPEKAKQLIAASKYGNVSNLPPIVLTTSGVGGDISGILGGVIEEWRRNLGVEVTVRQLEPETFLYGINQEKDQLFESGWIADYPDPQDFLDLLFHTGAQNNIGNYSNSHLDSLLDQAALEQDSNARLQTYQAAEQLIVQDAAILPICFGTNYVVVEPYVKDYVLSPLGYPLLNQVSIQK